MGYLELPLPARTPAHLEEAVRKGLDPLLADVHAMFRLPQPDVPGLEAGCNLSVALTLLSVVGGISFELVDDTSLGISDDNSGERFMRTLERHFPWDHEKNLQGAVTGRHAARLLYDAFRNPLSHNLGRYKKGTSLGNIKVDKGPNPLTEEELDEIERSTERPNWEQPTLAHDGAKKATRTKTLLLPKALYWGVRQMVSRIITANVAPTVPLQGTIETVRVSATARTTNSNVTWVQSGSTEPYGPERNK